MLLVVFITVYITTPNKVLTIIEMKRRHSRNVARFLKGCRMLTVLLGICYIYNRSTCNPFRKFLESATNIGYVVECKD